MSTNGVALTEKKAAAWYASLLLRALPLAETLEEAVAAVEVALSHNPEPDAEVSAMFGWVATNTTNRDGLPGWKNQETGEYRYQKTWPGTHRWAAPDTPAGIRTPATPESPGGGRPAVPPQPGGGLRTTRQEEPATPRAPKSVAATKARSRAPQGFGTGAGQPEAGKNPSPSGEQAPEIDSTGLVPPEEPAAPAQQQPAAAPPQTPASGLAPPTERSPTHEAAHQDVFEGFVNSVEMNHLPAETAEHYAKAGLQVFDRMSEVALKRFKAGHGVIWFAPDNEALNQGARQLNPDLAVKIDAGGRVAGLYSKYTKRLFLDGDAGNKFKAHEAYAHEFMHAVDGPDLEISSSAEWQEAWQEEIKGKGISPYAGQNAQEGLAEFGRLLWTHDDPETVLANYPKAVAALRKFGVI